MKMIKGNYEKILRQHESIENFDYVKGDFFLRYQYPNNFLVDLFVIGNDIEQFEEYDVANYIQTLPVARAKEMTALELRKIVKAFVEENPIVMEETDGI